MQPTKVRILTVNGGSSSIKFALFDAGDSLQRVAAGAIERIGLPDSVLQLKELGQTESGSQPVAAPDHAAAVEALLDWIEEHGGQFPWLASGIAWCMAGRSISTRSKSLRR